MGKLTYSEQANLILQEFTEMNRIITQIFGYNLPKIVFIFYWKRARRGQSRFQGPQDWRSELKLSPLFCTWAETWRRTGSTTHVTAKQPPCSQEQASLTLESTCSKTPALFTKILKCFPIFLMFHSLIDQRKKTRMPLVSFSLNTNLSIFPQRQTPIHPLDTFHLTTHVALSLFPTMSQ